jgi:hypothetical protein
MKLSAEPDGFGFFYGWVERNGERVRVRCPAAGSFVARRHQAQRAKARSEGAWVLYLDGVSGARMHLRCWALRVPRGRAGCWRGCAPC